MMKRTEIAIVVACVLWGMAGAAFSGTAAQWSYDTNSNQGPAHWGDQYSNCQTGGFQSPVDLRQADVTGKESLPVNLQFQALTGKLADDGHSVMLHPAAKFFTIGKASYSPLQFHFHSSAETLLNGQRNPVELHFVTQNDKGQYLVLAVFFEPGKSNQGLSRVLSNTKQEDMLFSQKEVAGFFPQNLDYYTFEGSLTTPPCSRKITWVVFTHPITASPTQIQQLQAEFQGGKSNYFRPVQPINHRPMLSGRAQA